MRPDGSIGPRKRNDRMTALQAVADEALISAAGDMFAAGLDTREMAARLIVPEAAVTTALRVARERQLGLAPAPMSVAREDAAGFSEDAETVVGAEQVVSTPHVMELSVRGDLAVRVRIRGIDGQLLVDVAMTAKRALRAAGLFKLAAERADPSLLADAEILEFGR
ncbi:MULTISPECIES: hypothetical protein [unclassified Bradyrhizobium]|uniref:hypothetical protein n=1 Tax=unclassified Bradyrhizobium TaxID=2631580 RepID=UPI0028E7DF70|nr:MULTISPECIES: hypothetical protein [unclassified Bradyrhizobium]